MSITDAYDAFLIDLDGVIWRGEEPIDGAAETIALLRSFDKRVIFVTNNASRSPYDYAVKLMRFQIPTEPSDIVTSAHAVLAELKARGIMPPAPLAICAGPGLRRVLEAAGYVAGEGDDAEALIVAWKPDLVYDDIKRAADLARDGTTFLAANDDKTFPAEQGLLPGAGSILAAIEAASGQQATVVGKPRATLFELALERAGVGPDRAIFVGDRPDTDVVGARAAGMATALVLTGVTDERDLGQMRERPDLILGSVADLLRAEPPRPAPAPSPVAPRDVPPAAESYRHGEHEAGDEATEMRQEGDAPDFGLPEPG